MSEVTGLLDKKDITFEAKRRGHARSESPSVERIRDSLGAMPNEFNGSKSVELHPIKDVRVGSRDLKI